jgi:uncharacterized membrane protein YeaQ/YmgE (transglycosylase-associated protein family)
MIPHMAHIKNYCRYYNEHHEAGLARKFRGKGKESIAVDLIVSVIVWMIVGALGGWLASVVMGTSRGQSLGEDIVVGIVGGVLGGFILDVLDIGGRVSGINIASILVAFFGAVVLLLILKAGRGTAQV